MAMAMSSSNHSNNPGSSDYVNTGTDVVDCKDENGSSNIMIKTFPYLTITVYIPTACVGVLIGKRGSNIDSIQKLAAKESLKSNSSSRGGARNKSVKQNNKNNGGGNQKAVSPESVRISVVNAQHQQNFEHFKNSHILGETVNSSNSGQQQQQQQQHMAGSSLMDMGVPPTYTELDFSDPQWTPIVIRADPIAAIYAANAIHDICCPEYVTDRNQLVYIMDVPVPAVAAGNTNNANLRHASIVGKRGNKLIQLSADHKCRIMVPPKQLGHNVIQLEAPLKECCSCLKAVLVKLQTGGYTSGNEEKEQQHQQQGDATKTSLATPPPKNSKNNAAGNKGNKNDNGKNSFQMTLIIQPLPSQTKLRNIARKTETKILKKRIPKSQRNQKHHQQQKEEQEQELKQLDQSLEEGEAGDQNQEKQEQGASNNASNNNNSDSKVSWRLTVVATSEKKVMKAVDMLKVLNSKGYEVIVEELGANSYVDTSSKSVSEGGLEDDTDMGAWTESPINGGTVDASKSPATNNGNNGRSVGRGGRSKKQRHRNNHKGNNGKDNNANSSGGKQQQQQVTISTTAEWVTREAVP